MIALDVLLWRDAPGARGGHDDWPAECREVGEGAPVPDAPWQRMTLGAYAAHRAAHEVAQAAWVEANPPPAPVPVETSLRGLLFALRDGGWITHAEALGAARTGAMPATLTETLAQGVAAGMLTPKQAEDAELTWAAMYAPMRSDPLWDLFVASGVATTAQVDDLFRRAAEDAA